MKYIQLYQANTPLIASDGVTKIDGRYNLNSIRREIVALNERLRANFPHKVCTGFAICAGPFWNNPGKIINL